METGGIQVSFEQQFNQQFFNYTNVDYLQSLKSSGENQQIPEIYRDTHTKFAELTKKISQIIAKSWMSDPEGLAIKKALLEGDSTQIKDVFKKGFKRENQEEIKVDIDGFFEPMDVCVRVDWNTFFGSLQEIVAKDETITMNLPYPPKPVEVTDTQLTEWVNNDEESNIYPTAPYIPLSCC